MSECKQICELGNPYKVVDYTRDHRKGIIACSLKQLINTARTRFNFPVDTNITVVLEQDGTEIDDEEYFATLEENTNLMVLHGNQKWISAETKQSTFLVLDDTDFSNNDCIKTIGTTNFNYLQIKSIVSTLYKDPSYIYLLTGTDLEMLSNMDPDKVTDIISDSTEFVIPYKYVPKHWNKLQLLSVYCRLFIDQLKEVSSKFLADKRRIKESIDLLQIFSNNKIID